MEKRFTYPSDPLWTQQWALVSSEPLHIANDVLDTIFCIFQFNRDGYGKRGLDLNVVSAWIQGFTGAGVVVAVVDDGM